MSQGFPGTPFDRSRMGERLSRPWGYPVVKRKLEVSHTAYNLLWN